MPLTGILAVDKEPGWTSHDVVARVRRLAEQREVGHAGTLDPLATGLLLVVLGGATRLSSVLMESPKTYLAEVVLGATTATDDAEAPVLSTHSTAGVERAVIEAVLPRFVGELEQIPPQYAAVRHGGQKMYQLARRGITVEAPPRRVTIHTIDLVAWENPRLRLRVTCGAGTYIRSLARDIGAALEVGGYLHALRRVASGTFNVREAHTLAALQETGVRISLLPPDRALLHWPAAVIDEAQGARVRHGQAIDLGAEISGNVRLYEPNGCLLALASGDGCLAKPFRVFSQGENVRAGSD